MSIDPRLKERRKVVAEDRAKRSVTRLLRFIAVGLVAGSLVWLAFSPWFSVSAVMTEGVDKSDAHAILHDWEFRAGEPMIKLDVAGVTTALESDPWVAEAEVARQWPNRVTVTITERVPVAWVQTDSGWARRDLSGEPLPSADQPDDALGRVVLPEVTDGDTTTDPVLMGALEFIATLPGHLAPRAEVFVRESELWAVVNGHQVRLGRPIDMAAKALSLVALLEHDIPSGSILVLVAPTNPAITSPGADQGEEGG